MDKNTKKRVKGVAIFIVFLAIATSLLEYRNKEGKPQNFDFKPSQQEYRDLKFINKAQISFTTHDVRKAQDGISAIISEVSVKQVRKQTENSYGAYLFSIPQAKLPELMERLRSFGVIGSHIEQIDTSLVNLDYESEMARLTAYEREQSDLNAIRFPSDSQNRRKESLHGLLHSTRQNLDKLKDADNVLLFISLTPIQKESSSLLIVKFMVVNFFSWLGVYAVGMVIVYFGTRLLMYFLAALGIKGLSAGGIGGNYQYGGYGNYASKYTGRYSGYGGGKRKVKRVYKDKKTTPESTDNSKTT